MKLWPVEHFWLTFFPNQCWFSADSVLIWKKISQKCATGQSFIWTEVTSYKIHILKDRVDDQTIHFTENLVSMNLLQISCVITWAQKKISLQTKKKWGRFLSYSIFLIGISAPKFLNLVWKFSCQPQKGQFLFLFFKFLSVSK